MQKVEGSSPFIRLEKPRKSGLFVWPGWSANQNMSRQSSALASGCSSGWERSGMAAAGMQRRTLTRGGIRGDQRGCFGLLLWPGESDSAGHAEVDASTSSGACVWRDAEQTLAFRVEQQREADLCACLLPKFATATVETDSALHEPAYCAAPAAPPF